MKTSPNPIANPAVVFREEFDDWALLFNPDTADAVGINPVGVAVWKLMDGHHSIEDIVGKLRDVFSEVPGTASGDVSAFIDHLADNGFVGYETDINDP